MSGLKAKFEDFLKITDCKMHYEFCNGFLLEFQFKKTNFPHMIGLHKLKDMTAIQTYAGKAGFANQVLSKIKKMSHKDARDKQRENFLKENSRWNQKIHGWIF